MRPAQIVLRRWKTRARSACWALGGLASPGPARRGTCRSHGGTALRWRTGSGLVPGVLQRRTRRDCNERF
jgi:hypothetical protein